jgi:glutamate/tyrosine decarboxylase-like PLP-dependent enzyme
MKVRGVRSSAFIDPAGGNRDRVERLLVSAIGVLLDHLSTAASRPPLPPPAAKRLPVSIPDRGRPEGEILIELRRLVERSANVANPSYAGHMDTLPSVVSVLGEIAAAGLNNNMLSREMSGIFTDLERSLTAEIARYFGLPAGSGGVLASGGTLANLQALAVARNARLGVKRKGMAGIQRRPLIVASEGAHTSIEKAAMLLGLGTDGVERIPADRSGGMDPDALRRFLHRPGKGRFPFALVGTAGTTVAGAIDPLPELAVEARKAGLWFHVDASYGGAMVFSPSLRGRLRGIALADTITFNPQKWAFVTKASAMVLFREMKRLDGRFRIGAPYMGNGDGLPNLGEISLQGTRPVEVLKLWLTFLHLGTEGIAGLTEEACRLTRRLADRLGRIAGVEVAAPPPMNILAFRVSGADRRTEALQRFLLARGVFLSLPNHAGRRWIKAVLLNPYLDEGWVDRLSDSILEYMRSGISQRAAPKRAENARI